MRTPTSNELHAAQIARAGALLVVLGGAAGCAAYPTHKPPVPVDCTVENRYDIESIDAEFMMPWASPDQMNGGATMTAAVTPLPDGSLCGDTTAFLMQGANNNDWGSLAGFYSFGPHDESSRTGLSFWARISGNVDPTFNILIDDYNTYDPYITCTADAGAIPPIPDSGVNCTTYCTSDGGAGSTMVIQVDQNGTPISSGTSTVAYPSNGCGNAYQLQQPVVVTADWRFYTIPFYMFQQPHDARRVSSDNPSLNEQGTAPGTPMLTNRIDNMTFRFPKGGPVELWIDRLGFYRPKAGDGGAGQ
jgi:hypothetical protein